MKTNSNRKEFNMEILRQLKHYMIMYPDIRFGQSLVNLSIIVNKDGHIADPYYEEPEVTLKRIKEEQKRIGT